MKRKNRKTIFFILIIFLLFLSRISFAKEFNSLGFISAFAIEPFALLSLEPVPVLFIFLFFGLIIFKVWIKSRNNFIRKKTIEKYSLDYSWDYSKFSVALPDDYIKYFNITSNEKSYFYAIMSKNIDGIEVSVMDYYYFSNKRNCNCNHTLIFLKKDYTMFPKLYVINKKKFINNKQFEIGIRFSKWGNEENDNYARPLGFNDDRFVSENYTIYSSVDEDFFDANIRDAMYNYASDICELETYKDSLIICYDHVMNMDERIDIVSRALKFFNVLNERVND